MNKYYQNKKRRNKLKKKKMGCSSVGIF
jgi:hypothetical protein